MIGMAVINAIVFGVQGNIMRRYQSDDRTPPWVKSSLSGAAAGAVQSLICCPVELFKLRRQIQEDHVGVPVFGHHGHDKLTSPPRKHNLLHITETIYHKEGLRGFFKGMIPTLWREVPSFGAYFATYDLVCQSMLDEGQSVHDLSPVWVCLAGGLSGIAAWLVTYPVDLVKSRIQIDGVDGPPQYRNMADCFRKTYQESRTIRVFFKGLNSTLLRAFPVNAVTFATVTLILRQWRKEEL